MARLTRPLRLGMKSPDVETLHARLAALGLSVDQYERSATRFGASTRRAVLAYQAERGLAPTGEVDAATAALLSVPAVQTPAPKPDAETMLACATLTPTQLAERSPQVAAWLRQKALETAAGTLRAQLRSSSKELGGLVSQAQCLDALRDPSTAGTGLTDGIRQAGASAHALALASRKWREFDAATTLEKLTRPEVPIERNPLIRTEILAARLHGLGRSAGIAAVAMDALYARGLNALDLTPSALIAAREAGALTPSAAQRVASIVSLYRLMDHNPGLAAALQAEPAAQHADPAAAGLAALAGWQVADWEAFLARQGAAGPDGLSASAYAAQIAGRVATLFPSAALLARLDTPAVDHLAEDLAAAQPRLDIDPSLLRRGGALEPLAAGAAREVAGGGAASADGHLVRLRSLTRSYPGLALADVLQDGASAVVERARLALSRVSALHDFCNRNAGLELLHLDFRTSGPDLARIDFGTLDPDERGRTLRTLKAWQRLHRVTGDVDLTHRLLLTGYDSAASIVADSHSTLQANTGLTAGDAARCRGRARQIAAGATAALGAAIDLARGGYNDLAVTHVDPTAGNFLASVDGFAELFGNQDFCECRECSSVLSPAAYFVDLMVLLDRYVGRGAPASTPSLALFDRRPDLLTLPLTCANTNDLLSQLQIVSEIFATYIAANQGYSGALSDLDGVLAFADAQVATSAPRSFRQPSVPALERVTARLGAFDTTRTEVARAVGVGAQAAAAAAFGLSTTEYALVTQPNTSLPFLSAVYGIAFELQAAVVKPLQVKLLLAATGLQRCDLGELIGALNGIATATRGIAFVSGRSDGAVQNDMELITGLNLAALDLIQRFTRLWRRQDLPIREFVLTAGYVRAVGTSTVDLDDACVQRLAQGARIRQLLAIGAEDACAMIANMPRIGFASGARSLFDRVFNPPALVAADGLYPKDTVVFTWPTQAGGSDVASQATLLRLMATLQLGVGELYVLVDRLWPRLLGPVSIGVLPKPKPGHSFTLDLTNLTRLYRHVRLARSLGLSIEALFDFIQTTPEFILWNDWSDADEVLAVVDHARWLEDLGLVPSDLFSVATVGIRGKPTGGSADLAAIARTLVQAAQSDRAMFFTSAVFAALPGLKEADSSSIVTANPTRIVAAPDPQCPNAWRLADPFDPSLPLQIPAGLTVDEPAARALLLLHHAPQVVAHYLAAQRGRDVAAMQALLRMTGLDLAAPEIARGLRGEAPPDALFDLVTVVLPLDLLFAAPVFDAAALQFVAQHPAIFAIDTLPEIGLVAARNVYRYRRWLEGAAGRYTSADLNVLIASFDAAANPGKFAAALEAKLALVLDWDVVDSHALQAQLALPASPIDALQRLMDCAALAKRLHVGGGVMPLIAAETAGELNVAAQALERAIATACPDRQEAVNEAFLGRYRDALAEYLMRSMDKPFKQASDLYDYFLIDPQVEGCFKTSRLVAAISTLQLYVQRVLMNLERDDLGMVRTTYDPELKDEWTWRRNYQIWVANRKVFLWPETFLAPDTRDDKTPLFDDLEAQLQQKQIDEQAVLDVYADYLRGFEEMTRLRIAGTYHDLAKNNNTLTGDTLHLFGATADEPPIYYHRQAENSIRSVREQGCGMVWSPWRKIDLNIPVRQIAALVFNNRLHVFWLEVSTTHNNAVSNGASNFIGYTHKLALKFSALRLDGRWTAPQRISLKGPHPFEAGDGQVDDPLMEPVELANFVRDFTGVAFGVYPPDSTQLTDDIRKMLTPRYADYGDLHLKAEDGYTLSHTEWKLIYPEARSNGIAVVGAGYQLHGLIDLFARAVQQLPYTDAQRISRYEVDPLLRHALAGRRETDASNAPFLRLYNGSISDCFCEPYGYAALVLDEQQIDRVLKDWPKGEAAAAAVTPKIKKTASGPTLADGNVTASNPGFEVTPGATPLGGDLTLLKSELYKDPVLRLPAGCELAAINSPLRCTDAMSTIGQDALVTSAGDLLLLQGSVYDGAFYRLTRIGTTRADDLARCLYQSGIDGLLSPDTQRLAEDAVAGQSELLMGIPPVDRVEIVQPDQGRLDVEGPYGMYYREIFFHIPFLIANLLNSQGQYESAQRWYHRIFDPTTTERTDNNTTAGDCVWRYLPFRDQADSMSALLTSQAALEAYRRHPFSPHAIARLRHTAYQKATVMRYVDNLLDWGDSLFAQFQMETVNQATMLYMMAQEVLGPAPAQSGNCAPPAEGKSALALGEMLQSAAGLSPDFMIELEHEVAGSPASASGAAMRRGNVELLGSKALLAGSASAPAPGDAGTDTPVSRNADWKNAAQPYSMTAVDTTTQAIALFCIPQNPLLMARWQRVADRLYKIRNCLDIDGNRRDLTLFAPEISPDLLIQAGALGLGAEDVLGAPAWQVPPYRFTFLVEKARQFAGSLESFGNALLAALEKKEAEQLALLRTTHEQNLLALTTSVRQWEADAADRAVEELQAKATTVTNRRDHYQQLLGVGLIPDEATERSARQVASLARMEKATVEILAAALQLVPDLGSPFAMKYGGTYIGPAMADIANSFGAISEYTDALASAAGMQAGFVRREQEWQRQLQQAQDELAEVAKQQQAAELRQKIAQRAIVSQSKSLEQNQEVLDFLGEKVTGLSLYIWLSQRLRTLYRTAYGSAYALARMAERAYRFERDDDSSTLLSGQYWDAPYGGLLAAGRLRTDLENLERRFLETNYREFEVEQSFSLLQLDPVALLTLRENASCEFTLPEFAFDLFYPGQHARKIRAVRLSIPSIAGPYTNVSATLQLKRSAIRRKPAAGALTPVPPERTMAIATSSANNDGGAFELSFRDERYLPFEGVGAVETKWELRLPSAYRPFDYNTITDVVLHLSYTARYDEDWRKQVEPGLIKGYLRNPGLGQLLSLRRDLPDAFQRLIASPCKTAVGVHLDRQIPSWLAKATLAVDQVVVFIRASLPIGAFGLTVNDVAAQAGSAPGWATDFDTLQPLTVSKPLTGTKTVFDEQILTITSGGGLAPKSGTTAALDATLIQDILVYIPYRITP